MKCVLVLLCVACTQPPPGRKLASGLARGLIARDGAVAFLLEASHPDDPAVPDDLLAGDLWLDDRKAGSGVSVQEGAYAFSPRGSDLAFLARWRFREGEGELWVDGRELALLSTGKQPGEATGDLHRLTRSSGASHLVATRVADWRWGGAGDLLCLARYDVRARAGTLSVATAGGAAAEIAAKVQSFSVSGRRVLYLVQTPEKGDFKLELWGVDLSTRRLQPRRFDQGVYGWALSPDGVTLYYKARCAGGPRSCSLLRAPFAGGAPEMLAANVSGFDLSRDGRRILLQQPHHGAARAVDLAVLSADGAAPGRVKSLVEEVDPSSRFADDEGKRVVYAIVAAAKGGVFLADVP